MKFLELGLPEPIANILRQSGIDTPTPIQDKAIPLALAGKDLLASAKTGSGKTLAFALPILTRMIDDPRATALVLVPTRELADQVLKVTQPYLKALKMPEPCLLIGGVAFGPQISGLRRKPRVIVATPGRLLDHLTNGQLKLDSVRYLILDEADRMLDMGFAPQVRSVVRHLPAERQTLLFTATIPDTLQSMLKELLKHPEKIFVDPPSTSNVDIDQQMAEMNMDQKNNQLLESVNATRGAIIVFARTKKRVDRVAHFLRDYGVKVDSIHGDRSQGQRTRAIEGFRKGTVKVLAATDIAARGIDIPQVELVINYDLPEVREDYVHRIGRTGRAGAKGTALSYVTPEERDQWEYLQGRRKNSAPLPRAQKPPRPAKRGGAGGGGAGGRGRPGGKPGGGRPASAGAGAGSGGGFKSGGKPAARPASRARSSEGAPSAGARSESRPGAGGGAGAGAGAGATKSGPRRAGWGHQASKKRRWDESHWVAAAEGLR